MGTDRSERGHAISSWWQQWHDKTTPSQAARIQLGWASKLKGAGLSSGPATEWQYQRFGHAVINFAFLYLKGGHQWRSLLERELCSAE